MQYFLGDHTTVCQAYSFTTDGYGIFNVRNTFRVRAVHTKGGRHKQVCTRVDSEGQKQNNLAIHPAPPGDRTHGLRIWTTDLRPQSSCVLPLCCPAFGIRCSLGDVVAQLVGSVGLEIQWTLWPEVRIPSRAQEQFVNVFPSQNVVLTRCRCAHGRIRMYAR